MTAGRSMITTGPDGRMWFTTRDHLGAITMDGVVTEYQLPPQTFPSGITAGADGRMWFGCTGAIARITTAGQVTLFSTGHPHSQVQDVVEGPDGNVWFVEFPHADLRVSMVTFCS